jgi:transcriptional regulator with XRE-family HTH domain
LKKTKRGYQAHKETERTAMKTIPMQTIFDKEIPDNIRGNSEYLIELEILQNMSRLLHESGAEDEVIRLWLAQAEKDCAPKKLPDKARIKTQQNALFALRATVLRKYRNLSYRELARELALAPLYQWFCGLNRWTDVRIPSKSKLQAYEQALPEELGRALNSRVVKYSMAESGVDGVLGIEAHLDLSECFFDTFCLETNIHYPVDWVLLRDASRTLMLAVLKIREHGIVNRMAEGCQLLLSRMNKLCIEMTHSSRRIDGKKTRKRCFRKMKKLVKRIEKHAHKHLSKLSNQWHDTDLTEGQMQQILDRIENVLKQLPEAIRQGHERVIGGRRIKSEDKILSLYEHEVNVIVRRKTGAEVEFGNKASLMEQKQGLIIDWDLAEVGSPGDPQLCQDSYDRAQATFGPIAALATDRGCNSRRNSTYLKKHNTYDATCPRSIEELSLRMTEEDFKQLQKRRGSTEARISILQKFTGGRLKCKGYAHRSQQLGLCVFTHNLWLVSRLMIAGKCAQEEAPAKLAG